MEGKEEIWKKALLRWDAWSEAVAEARDAVRGNKEFLAEARHMGERFIRECMGLDQGNRYFNDFVDYWLHLVMPEVVTELSEELLFPDDIDFLDEIHPDVSYTSRVVRVSGRDLVLNSVSWYQGGIDTESVAEKLKHMIWPRPISSKKRRVGRPSERDRIDREAIVCAILADKQKLKNREIAELFPVKRRKRSEDDAVGSSVEQSRTVLERSRRGRELLAMKRIIG